MERPGRSSRWGHGAGWRAAFAASSLICASLAVAQNDGLASAPASAAAPTAMLGADVALQALALVGTPYRFGGDEPARGFDCSGLVRHVARAVLGVDLPRTSEAIARASRPVSRAELQGGDLVFFNTRGQRNSHVGVYLGDGRFVHAPSRNGLVRVEVLTDRYWHARFNGARRLPGVTAETMESAAPGGADAGVGGPRRDDRPGAPAERHPADGA